MRDWLLHPPLLHGVRRLPRVLCCIAEFYALFDRRLIAYYFGFFVLSGFPFASAIARERVSKARIAAVLDKRSRVVLRSADQSCVRAVDSRAHCTLATLNSRELANFRFR